jgi:hypothetical protein
MGLKLVIAGSRTIKNYACLTETVDRVLKVDPDFIAKIEEVVSGTAIGPDQLGERWAQQNDIPIKRMPADWSKGRGAGHIRNAEMAKYADIGIILWDGVSPGTRGMINQMQLCKKPYFLDVYKVG